MAHLEGIKLLLGCVSSPERGWEALSKMKISFFMFYVAIIFRRQSASWTLHHGFMLSSCFLMRSKKYVWIGQGQLHSAPQWMQSHIFCRLICLTIYAFTVTELIHVWHQNHTWKKNNSTTSVCDTDLFMFPVGRWGSSNRVPPVFPQFLWVDSICSFQSFC